MEDNSTFEEESLAILRGLEVAYAKMIEFKKLKNSPVVISVNGKVLEVSANEIEPTTTYSR